MPVMPGFVVGGKRQNTKQVCAHNDQRVVRAVVDTSTEISEQLQRANETVGIQSEVIKEQRERIKEQRERILNQNETIEIQSERILDLLEIIEDQRDVAKNNLEEIENQRDLVTEMDELNVTLITALALVTKRLELADKELAEATKRLELAYKKLDDLQGESKGYYGC